MSSSLGLTIALPPGTLESGRAEELSRRQQKQHQLQQTEQQADAEQPRRLAPQRKKKPPSYEQTLVLTREPLPISIRPDDSDDDDVCEHVTSNVADWTLNNADKIKKSYLYDDDEGNESYHGEIESIEENQSINENDSVIDEESDDGGFKIISEDDVPLDPPPPSMPLVLVDLELLCGCAPYDEEEKEVIVSQLMEMLLGSVQGEEEDNDQDEDGENNKTQSQQDLTKGDGLSLDFDERVVELFESGAAVHVDTMMPAAIACAGAEKKMANEATTDSDDRTEKIYPFTLIPYPEFLSSKTSSTSRSTIRLWKLLNNSHPSPLLSRIFLHLKNTSRSLLWKADMYQELCSLAKQEYNAQIKREQMREYTQWKETVRKERLEKLYDVRETFQLRVDVARRKHSSFVEEREQRVERELKRRDLYQYRITSQKHVQDHFNDIEKDSDEDGWDGPVNEEEIFGDEVDDIEENSQNDGDEWSPLGLSIDINRALNPENCVKTVQKVKQEMQNDSKLKQLEPITHSDNQNRKSERRQNLKDQTSAATNNNYFEKNEAAIREALKTNDERIAEAVLVNLEEKLKNVDELLESLQEEEWADEDEDESCQPLLNAVDCMQKSKDFDDSSEMTLLDQILAMILGALSKESTGANDDKQHFAFVKNEHASIVSSWKKTFGRLPPFPSSEPDPGKSSEMLVKNIDTLDVHFGDFLPTEISKGLTPKIGMPKKDKVTLRNNEKSAWDEIDDWDAFFSS